MPERPPALRQRALPASSVPVISSRSFAFGHPAGGLRGRGGQLSIADRPAQAGQQTADRGASTVAAMRRWSISGSPGIATMRICSARMRAAIGFSAVAAGTARWSGAAQNMLGAFASPPGEAFTSAMAPINASAQTALGNGAARTASSQRNPDVTQSRPSVCASSSATAIRMPAKSLAARPRRASLARCGSTRSFAKSPSGRISASGGTATMTTCSMT